MRTKFEALSTSREILLPPKVQMMLVGSTWASMDPLVPRDYTLSRVGVSLIQRQRSVTTPLTSTHLERQSEADQIPRQLSLAKHRVLYGHVDVVG